jgi:hypothetical protein
VDQPTPQLVTQTFNSAISVAYSSVADKWKWEPLARLVVLEASYEATLLVGLINMRRLISSDECDQRDALRSDCEIRCRIVEELLFVHEEECGDLAQEEELVRLERFKDERDARDVMLQRARASDQRALEITATSRPSIGRRCLPTPNRHTGSSRRWRPSTVPCSSRPSLLRRRSSPNNITSRCSSSSAL